MNWLHGSRGRIEWQEDSKETKDDMCKAATIERDNLVEGMMALENDRKIMNYSLADAEEVVKERTEL